jgi:hypothetical protein
MSNLSRRRLLKGAALLLGFVLTQNVTPKTFTAPARTPPAHPNRPLRMLVIGDSVMWGQGLVREHKFSYMLRGWLCKQRNGGACPNEEDVQLHVEAHSGAIISEAGNKDDAKEDERFTRPTAPLKYEGEVNTAYPTILTQVDMAKRYYQSNSIPPEEVDLVILNGGINDLHATKLLLFKLHNTDVTKKAGEYSGTRMRALLAKTAAAFPNARIVVPGYFPLVSKDTPPGVIYTTAKEWLLGSGEENAGGGAHGASKLHLIRGMLAARSGEWVKASDNALSGAVNDLNDHSPPARVVQGATGAAPPDAFKRALFVHVPFDDKNAYGIEGTTFLWRLGRIGSKDTLDCADDNLIGRLVVDDELQKKRPCMCEQAGKGDNLFCVRAGAFHPNVAGASAYFTAIAEQLKPILPFTGWL